MTQRAYVNLVGVSHNNSTTMLAETSGYTYLDSTAGATVVPNGVSVAVPYDASPCDIHSAIAAAIVAAQPVGFSLTESDVLLRPLVRGAC